MKDKTLPDKEIVKALEECIELKFDDTEYATVRLDILTNALDLITHQQTENKRLEKEVNLVSIQFQDLQERYEEAQAEIERLKSCVKSEDEVREIAKRTMEPLVKEITREQIDIAVKYAKSEAYKEFAERLKEKSEIVHLFSVRTGDRYMVDIDDIDNTLKEMVGENNG